MIAKSVPYLKKPQQSKDIRDFEEKKSFLKQKSFLFFSAYNFSQRYWVVFRIY